MSIFQAILYGIVHGFTEFLPVSSAAHSRFISEIFGWAPPSEQLQGYFALSCLIAVFLYFIHDWASMISSFLQVLIYRKKPMTLDERMPFFLILATLPLVGAWIYLRETLPLQFSESIWMAAGLAFFAIPIALAEMLSRRNKGMFDWNWIDAIMVGIFQILSLVPGCGRMTGALMAGLFRNYNREAIAKFSFFASAPLLAGSAWLHLKGFGDHVPTAGDETWVTRAVVLVVTTLASLLAIGGFMKAVQRKSLNQYGVYRVLVAIAFGCVIWARSTGRLG